MGHLRLHALTINATDPSGLAHFWATMLGGTRQDEGDLPVVVHDGGRLFFQRAQGHGPHPAWVHLDFDVDDRERAIDAVVAAGGSVVDERRGDDTFSWTVLADPEGNPFCI